MRGDLHGRPGRQARQTYFVGRRPDEEGELYAVTATGVECLHSKQLNTTDAPDWHGSHPMRMGVSRLLLARVTPEPPSPELVARFALDVLLDLPEDGFVLSSEEIQVWLRTAADLQETMPPGSERSSLDRCMEALLRSLSALAGWPDFV